MGIISFLAKRSADYRQLEEVYHELVRRTSHILDAEESAKLTRQLLANLQQEYNVSLA